MTPILDTAIGTIFLFLLFSLVVTAANEIVLSFLDKRAKFLSEGLKELLGEEDSKKLLANGLISSLARGAVGNEGPWKLFGLFKHLEPGIPSYIPAKNFVLALLSNVGGEDLSDPAKLRASLASIENEKLKQCLVALYDDAAGDLAIFKASVEAWFNESMTRVAGWYKRHAQTWCFWLAFTAAVGCNVNTIDIVRTLSQDENLKKAVVDAAVQYTKNNPVPAGTTDESATKEPKEAIADFQKSIAQLEGTGMPLGWNDPFLARIKSNGSGDPIMFWLTTLAGWLITAFAASLGAPFWFDVLNRIVDLRGNGRAPEEKDETPPKKPAMGGTVP